MQTMYPPLTSGGHPIDTDPAHFGELRDSSAYATDGDALRDRMAVDRREPQRTRGRGQAGPHPLAGAA